MKLVEKVKSVCPRSQVKKRLYSKKDGVVRCDKCCWETLSLGAWRTVAVGTAQGVHCGERSSPKTHRGKTRARGTCVGWIGALTCLSYCPQVRESCGYTCVCVCVCVCVLNKKPNLSYCPQVREACACVEVAVRVGVWQVRVPHHQSGLVHMGFPHKPQ